MKLQNIGFIMEIVLWKEFYNNQNNKHHPITHVPLDTARNDTTMPVLNYLQG